MPRIPPPKEYREKMLRKALKDVLYTVAALPMSFKEPTAEELAKYAKKFCESYIYSRKNYLAPPNPTIDNDIPF